MHLWRHCLPYTASYGIWKPKASYNTFAVKKKTSSITTETQGLESRALGKKSCGLMNHVSRCIMQMEQWERMTNYEWVQPFNLVGAELWSELWSYGTNAITHLSIFADHVHLFCADPTDHPWQHGGDIFSFKQQHMLSVRFVRGRGRFGSLSQDVNTNERKCFTLIPSPHNSFIRR